MGLIVDIGMQNLLDLHLLLRRSFKRSNIYIPTIITHPTSFSNKEVLVIINKLKNPSFLKELILQTKGWLENHYQQSREMPSHSNKFSSPSSRLTRAKCKMLLMASLIKQIELQPLYLKEYLGVFRVLCFSIELCKICWVCLQLHKYYKRGTYLCIFCLGHYTIICLMLLVSFSITATWQSTHAFHAVKCWLVTHICFSLFLSFSIFFYHWLTLNNLNLIGWILQTTHSIF